MPRDYNLYIDDIHQSIIKIKKYTQNMTVETFSHDEKTIDAVIRNLEIIGEASNKIPEDIQQEYSDIEWRKIKGMRNILAHEYFGINTHIIWDVILNKLTHLESFCNKILKTI